MDHQAIKDAVSSLLSAVGEDPGRDGLKETPERVAEMYAEILSEVASDPADEIDVFFESDYDELIMLRDIPMYSICEHHLLPWVGKAHVSYIPNRQGMITGLSKLARVVDVASKRLQVQERLTMQIADAIESRLQPRGVLVVIEAEHLCMTIRGIKKPGSVTVTSAVRGLMRENPATRQEAMRLIRGRD
jgi:GTP cyclohydrolase I